MFEDCAEASQVPPPRWTPTKNLFVQPHVPWRIIQARFVQVARRGGYPSEPYSMQRKNAILKMCPFWGMVPLIRPETTELAFFS
jgi:hypothetical protein